MFELFLPYLIGMALGISPADGDGPATMTEAPAAQDRAPEDQTPTGQFTTATEIRPILLATTGNWAAVRNWEGQDLVYFTHLLAWRCGLWEIRYGVNGDAADTVLPMEPCHTDTGTPNALTDVENFLPYIGLPENSVEALTITIVYDDGQEQTESFDRARIQMP